MPEIHQGYAFRVYYNGCQFIGSTRNVVQGMREIFQGTCEWLLREHATDCSHYTQNADHDVHEIYLLN